MRLPSSLLAPALIVAVCVLSASAAQAQESGDRPHCGAPPEASTTHDGPPPTRTPHGGPGDQGASGERPIPLPPYLRGLTLTVAQQQKLSEIMHKHASQSDQASNELRQARDGIIELSLSEQYTDAAAESLGSQVSIAEAKLIKIRAQADHEIFLSLDTRQRAAALESLQHAQGPGGTHGDRGPPLPYRPGS